MGNYGDPSVVLLFTGNYRYSLDDKNRVIIPIKFREVLASGGIDKLFLIRGDNQLHLIPYPAYIELSDKLKSWDITMESKQDYLRRLYAESFEVVPDKQGRIMLRPDLCQETGITQEVVILGVLDRMEIWSPEKWREFREKSTLRGFSANLDVHSQR